MSQTDELAVEGKKNPVGAQDSPAGFAEDVKKAVTEAVTDMFAVTSWTVQPRVRFKIECPSGQVCLAQHLTTMDLVEADLVEEIDFFTKRLFPSNFDENGSPTDDSEGKENESIWKVLRDIDKRLRFFALLNKLCAIGISKPKVIDDGSTKVKLEGGKEKVVFGYQMTPSQQIKYLGSEIPALKVGEVYGGAIDFADKMTIFAELNKPLSQITPFRKEQNVVLASMEPSEISGR